MNKKTLKRITSKYKRNKDALLEKGINSVSSYITFLAGKDIEESKSLKNIAEKITKLPNSIKIPQEYFPLDF